MLLVGTKAFFRVNYNLNSVAYFSTLDSLREKVLYVGLLRENPE